MVVIIISRAIFGVCGRAANVVLLNGAAFVVVVVVAAAAFAVLEVVGSGGSG